MLALLYRNEAMLRFSTTLGEAPGLSDHGSKPGMDDVRFVQGLCQKGI